MARKQKMKVYHGLPKSTTDKHTILYASLDGVSNPEIGTATSKYASSNTLTFKPNFTGYGSKNIGKAFKLTQPTSNEITIDFYSTNIQFSWWAVKLYNDNQYVGCLYSNGNSSILRLYCPKPSTHYDLVGLSEIPTEGHIRWCHNLVTGESSLYVNGSLIKKTSTGIKSSEVTIVAIGAAYDSAQDTPPIGFKISDLHVSNIDRGDYFPNLPQDFIDGKAVIKPRMGQQQIKGDPMYSQVTELKVSVTNANDWVNVANGFVQSVINPEISLNDGGFPSGSLLKIKGLNGEVISGVIDTDTALCRVLRAIETNHLVVDSIDKLSVGDQLRAIRATDMVPNPSSVYYQITEIHPETSSIVVIRADGGDGWRQSDIDKGYTLAIEITASSSSPTVKTKEGTNVVGTWSGLGTTEATFTLGDNSNIVGKDLYVTYALTMPLGNSDFPEIPYSIEKAWGENGVEMKPVDKIMIVDDFKGKIALSDKACPHKMGYGYNSKLLNPSEITETKFSRYYESLSKLDDIVDTSTSNSETTIPQQLFSFNVIEMVERKLGCEIPSRDKVQWLKENLDSSASIVHYGYGVHPTGNLLKINWFNPAMNEWTLNGGSHASGSISKLENGTSMLADRIDSNGFVHILVYTNASNDAKSSTIHTDYVCLKIKLKVNSTYTYLYGENTRAREDVCNPVLVQKETKTVKRYLPSKECFVTECNYSSPTVKELDLANANVLIKDDFVYVTTQGTGNVSEIVDSMYKNCIAKLGVYIESCKYDNEILTRFDNYFFNTNFEKVTCVSYPANDFYVYPVNLPQDKNVVVLKPYVIEEEGEVLLGVYIGEYVNGVAKAHHFRKYLILNRPLIK